MAASVQGVAGATHQNIGLVDLNRAPSLQSSHKHGDSDDFGEKNPQVGLEEVNTNATGNTGFTTFDSSAEAGLMFKKNGEMILMPAATKDPRDPLNLPMKRKVLGLFFLCFFGALAASAELILGAMLPVFALEYAHIDPKILQPISEQHLLPADTDALKVLSMLPGAPPIWQTYLLGSLPLLMMGLANLILIPLAISIGRRPVVLGSGVIAIAGAIWAGFSHSLGSHIGARCIQAIGAGTVESLIPFIIQDMVYFHQRNTAISGVFAAQGTIIIGLGIAAPHLIIELNWRWVYYLTSMGAGVFMIGVYFFMPETRWHRTKAELNGIPRPEWKERDHAPRTWAYDLALYRGPCEWRKGLDALMDSLRTFFYPHIFFVTMLNSAMIATAFAAAFTVTPQLLAAPNNWKFLNLGLCLVAVLIAAVCVASVTGKAADVVANYFAKKRGRRLPENQLINMVLPVLCGLSGSVVFGLAGQNPAKYPWPILLLGLGLMSFGFLGASTVGAVYVLESYPQLAGPALVNIASFRCILAFALSFKVSEWIVEMGYFDSMLVYTGVMGFFALLIPIVYIYGPAWRKRWPGPDR